MAQSPFLDDPQIDLAAIERRRQMAQALMQGSQQMPQGQMVSGHFVAPSWTQYAAKALQGISGMRGMDMADKDQKALAQQVSERNSADLNNYVTALRGAPARNIPNPVQNDDQGFALPEVNVPASAADPNKALAIALASRNPALQQAGLSQLKEMTAGPKWEKVELPNADGSKRVGYVNVNSRDPLSTFQAGGTAPVKLEAVNTGGGTSFVNPFAPKAEGAPTIAATANPFKDLLVGNPGAPTVNTPLVEAKKAIQKAGATNVSVNTATKPFLSEIGKGVGEQVVNDFSGARSAVQTLNNVQQIEKGLSNAITGPAANARIKLSQIGEALGINGADATERLQNTRNVIQGLARQELAAAGSMKGQGQITEAERGILRRAESGSVEELTVPELRTLTGALKKTANYRIGLHNSNLERLKKDPNAAGVVDYMNVAPSQGGNSVLDAADAIIGGGK